MPFFLLLILIVIIPTPSSSFSIPANLFSGKGRLFHQILSCDDSSQITISPVIRYLNAKSSSSSSIMEDDKSDDDDNDIEQPQVEIVNEKDEFQYDDDDEDWLPDKEKAKRRAQRQQNMKPAEENLPPDFRSTKNRKPAGVHIDDINMTPSANNKKKNKQQQEESKTNKKRLEYTDEEEELIQALGGKEGAGNDAKREPGFLGDCTLKEIASDFQVPICYLADVLCTWGVAAPIDVYARLGDLVTGEQAFAILEAIHTLDLGVLNDRYSDMDLITLCAEYDIELKKAFDFVVKEEYSLPFGVRTFLRVEQEDDLIRSLAKEDWL
eukprot:CAMPEP_0197829112 /NCGR_PEP_ID=MMETSP1437-20131217/5573_1 /TAXON_ID=49252 ORGANISM="Eucampia antarctica, Strain CCMP1452" /NCGR_SAMPLE_ID=MMETSP1437 /ASSEMBLY_ACC=CAM_ASM_001096 /LENGTH=323 /DNA_ID=CAMNT_0043430611 /DNA_START=77 /DNA_END=1048 /DNA_ORIENTATION=+